MSVPGIIVERREASDHDAGERWSRRTDDVDVLGVEAIRRRDGGDWPWQVHVSVAEFLREAPLDIEFDISVDRALRSVEGVTDVQQEDREVWIVRGTPSGEAVVHVVSGALDRFAARIRIYLEEL